LFRSDKNTAFPYELNEKISINTSTLGTQFYYYFYDWEVKGLGMDCESERISFTVDYDTTTTETRTPIGGFTGEFLLFHNPTASVLELHPTGNCTALKNFRIFDLSGKSYSIGRMASNGHHYRIEVGALPAGTYILSVEACNQPLEFSFFKVN
nr:T9SS type A sorting domain-containing protein [Saprospiraceae bacterium]